MRVPEPSFARSETEHTGELEKAGDVEGPIFTCDGKLQGSEERNIDINTAPGIIPSKLRGTNTSNTFKI